MIEDTEIAVQFCEYCQESVPVASGTGETADGGCLNSMCPFDAQGDNQEGIPLDFNNDEVSRDEQIDYSGLVDIDEDGC